MIPLRRLAPNYEKNLRTGKIHRDVVRFLSKFEACNEGCWPWKAYVAYNGYGQIGLAGKVVYAHRFSYELFRGPIPLGLELDHLCRNRRCVNPWHLEVVTRAENTRRGVGVGMGQSRKTHCPHGHEYELTNTYRTRDGWRQCKICHRNRLRERRER